MVSWRAKKQLFILLIIVVPIVGIVFFATLRLLPEASCFDNTQNQGELGVDCGGPCESCALKNPESLTVFWARAVEVRKNTFDVVALIENPNEILGAPRIDYEFTLFDSFGLPVAVRTGNTFMAAQERVHVIEANMSSVREPAKVEFKVLDVSWVLHDDERLNVLVERRDYKVVEDAGRIYSTVETNVLNRTPYDLREVNIYFVVLDSDGNVLGANRVLVERLFSGESRLVKSIWPTELQGEVAKIEVEPRVNSFSPDIILKPQ